MQTNFKKLKNILPAIGLAAASIFYSGCGDGVFSSKKLKPDNTARIDDVMTQMANDYLSYSRNDPMTFVGDVQNPESDLQMSIGYQVINTFMGLPTRTCGYTHIPLYFSSHLPSEIPAKSGRILVGSLEYSPLVKNTVERYGPQMPSQENIGRIVAYKDGETLTLVITGTSQQGQINALEAITSALYEVDGIFDPKTNEEVKIKKFGDARAVDLIKVGGELIIEPVK